jgi:hypothetical protein
MHVWSRFVQGTKKRVRVTQTYIDRAPTDAQATISGSSKYRLMPQMK